MTLVFGNCNATVKCITANGVRNFVARRLVLDVLHRCVFCRVINRKSRRSHYYSWYRMTWRVNVKHRSHNNNEQSNFFHCSRVTQLPISENGLSLHLAHSVIELLFMWETIIKYFNYLKHVTVNHIEII